MEKYKHLQYNYSSYNSGKDMSVLYELALQRGKNRGWYPKDWNLTDYISHIFKTERKKVI
jgi:hypothetical protein